MVNTTLAEIKTMVDLMPGDYLVYALRDKTFTCVYATSGIPKLAGLNAISKSMSNNPLDYVMEEDRAVIVKKLRAFMQQPNLEASHASTTFSYRLMHEQKGFVWIRFTATSAGLIDGQPGFIANIIDVTKEMLNSYELMEASDRAICVIEQATKRFLYANTPFYDLIDATPSQAMGKHCYELLCKVPEMRTNDNCLCYSCINATEPLEYYNDQKDLFLSMTGRPIEWGEHESYVFYLADVTAAKRQDEELRNSQKMFEMALDNSDIMIWEYDMVNNRCINSEKAGRDYNIPLVIENYPESLFATGHTPPETVAQIKDVKRRLEAGETGFSVERRTVDKFGKSQWQKVDYALETDQDGKPLRAIVCGQDITERKELEQKYEAQMEYRNTLAAKALFSARLDLDANTLADHTGTNEVLRRWVSESPTAEGLLDQLLCCAKFPARAQATRDQLRVDAMRQSFALGRMQTQTAFLCPPLGKYLDLSVTLYKNPGTGHLEAFLVADDITRTELMSRAFQSVVAKDYDFLAVVFVETGALQILAKTNDSLMPATLDQGFDDYDELIRASATYYHDYFCSLEDRLAINPGMLLHNVMGELEDKPTYEFNYHTFDKQGNVCTFRMSFGYVDQERQQLTFARANVTRAVAAEQQRQRDLQQALDQAELANRAKTDFLSRMSHDMRTPMNGIMGMTRLTQDIPNLPAEAQENLRAVGESSAYLLQLINDTLDMSKIESNRFTLHYETVNVGELIQHIIATIQPMVDAKGIKLEFVPINAQLEYIRADRVRVQQLFLNVLSNSVKFTPAGGTIRMEVECLKRENGIAHDRISVADTGCGMSPEFLEHLFEPFSQEDSSIARQQEGTGLGMSIVKSLVEQMGGTIQVESAPGKGTKVTAFLDFQRMYDVDQIQAAQPREATADLAGKRVLLAEDHPLNATIATQLLAKRDVAVDHAKDGREAVELFATAPPDAYDYVLMDIRMPVMDGLAAARALRALDRPDAQAVPIIAMTANAYLEDVQAALDAGMDAHLAKPIDPDLLYAELERYA